MITADLFYCCLFSLLFVAQVIDELFSQLTSALWWAPQAEAVSASVRTEAQLGALIARHLDGTPPPPPPLPPGTAAVTPVVTQPAVTLPADRPVVAAVTEPTDGGGGGASDEALFDPEKLLCCSIELGHTLVHGAGGRGYGLGAVAITTGCYYWKVHGAREAGGGGGGGGGAGCGGDFE